MTTTFFAEARNANKTSDDDGEAKCRLPQDRRGREKQSIALVKVEEPENAREARRSEPKCRRW
ncbi:hypothetical protein IF1G_06096 [Cordyceps javanica]|uniref:Uncharacterized protein n=1 Tax=Cordyceps javanica TaxID=43265 RepID=A0A545VVF6_9HYPO|nr:hypothetical protein IF1G_06096 [Cordyceps javanica]TQW05687.1 hypothetical protein IF2G_06809 [Cordyceps javanica]